MVRANQRGPPRTMPAGAAVELCTAAWPRALCGLHCVSTWPPPCLPTCHHSTGFSLPTRLTYALPASQALEPVSCLSLSARTAFVCRQHRWDAGGGPKRAFYLNAFAPALWTCVMSERSCCARWAGWSRRGGAWDDGAAIRVPAGLRLPSRASCLTAAGHHLRYCIQSECAPLLSTLLACSCTRVRRAPCALQTCASQPAAQASAGASAPTSRLGWSTVSK